MFDGSVDPKNRMKMFEYFPGLWYTQARCFATVRGFLEIFLGYAGACLMDLFTPRIGCRGSLRRTGLERLSIGQLHWSAANYAPLQECSQVKGLAACYTEGLVREVGVSNYGAKQLIRVRDAAFTLNVESLAMQKFEPVGRGLP
jgi:hypothetical protein